MLRSLLLVALVSCVVLASFDTYYTVFGALLIAVAGIAAALARRRWRPLVSAALVIAGTTVVLLINSIPTLLWWWPSDRAIVVVWIGHNVIIPWVGSSATSSP